MKRVLPLMLAACLAHAGEFSDELRARIATQTAAAYPGFSAAVKDPKTTVSAVAAPWTRARIWRFEKFLPTRPLIFFVAVVGDEVVVLTGAPERFNRVLERMPAAADDALAITRLFDEATRKGDERRLLLRSVSDIPFRPGLSEEKAQLRDEAQKTLAPIIRPPAVRRLGRGDWQVVEHAIEGDLLVERTCTVAASIRCRARTLRDDLPLVYVNN